jgi:signal transduction histidine kinase
MHNKDEVPNIGEELAALLGQLPHEERKHYQSAIARMVHDLRQSVGIIYTAETLLRRKSELTPEDIELLDAIDTASKRAMGTLTDFVKPFDKGITVPTIHRPRGLK